MANKTVSQTRVKDLTDQLGSPFPRPFLYCAKCGGEYSAHRGDYFMSDPNTIMKCCRRSMALVIKSTVLSEVR